MEQRITAENGIVFYSRAYWQADRELWLTRDRERVVEASDTSRHFKFCTPGQEIPIADAERYGIVSR